MRPLLILSLALAGGRLAAQLAGPSPLAGPASPAVLVPGGWIVAEGRANAALQAGFPATAAGIYRDLLHDMDVPADSRQRLTLALVTAQLDAGELADAEKTLATYDGPRNTAYQLRAGLIAANARRIPAAKAALAAGKPDDLPVADKGWWCFLQAQAAEDAVAANKLYEQAQKTAVSDLQRARFLLGQEQARLHLGQATEASLAVAKDNMERFQGTRIGYDAVRIYAAALTDLRRGAEAQALLQRQLAVLPATERNAADDLNIALGLIAGERSVSGRQAFRQLLRDAQKPETQRLALQLLARGANTAAEREQFRRDLSELIGAPTQHPIIEDLLLQRALTALADKAYAPAEEDARALLVRYPGTPLKAAALGVRLAVAWDLKRFRAAADVIAQLRAVTPPGRERNELGVLLAEAFFRAEDFKNAAAAYEAALAALHEPPAVVPAGVLIFQLVLSDIRAEQLDAAAKQLDDAAANPGFDAVNRWQAEWNLVKELQARGQAPAAYARVNRLLAGGAQGVPEELRIRLMWLRAKLSFDNGQPEVTLQQADELLGALTPAAKLEPALRQNVTSMAQLLKAQALLALNRGKEGFALLEKLRVDFRATDAAQYSYLVQAGFLTQSGDMASAQQILQSFVDDKDYKHSDYAPVALYQIALNLERQGLDSKLKEANEKLEQLIKDYPTDEFVFYARLKQGDLLRKLNDFANARQIYESLINTQSQHPDILLAEIALADSLFAQGANSVANYESAAFLFERLRDLPSAPVDLRAEAGFKWGYALAKRAQPAKAQAVFWSVVDAFLLDATQAAKLGAKGRYWISRALLELGQIHEDAGRLDEAQRAYQLIVDYKLSGTAQAQAKLARFRTTGGTKP